MLDIQEIESTCYDYFVEKGIKNRAQLRECLKTNPINNVSQALVETLFSNFKEEQKVFTKKRDRRVEKTVCISDLHIPYDDSKAVSLVFDLLVDLQPQNLVLNGDIIDCYWCSDFIKKPKNSCYLQEEADSFYKKFSYLRRHLPNTNIYYILGNHEDRIKKMEWKNPQLYGLEAIQPSNLLKLDKLKIKYYNTKLVLNDFLYFHGERVRNNSSYSAKAEFEYHKMRNGISGHTHRLGAHYRTYDKDTTFWYENGCLCTLEPEYIKDGVDWQQGFSIVNNFEGLNQVEQILINNHKFSYNGVIYK